MARVREIRTGSITWRVRATWGAYRRFQDKLETARRLLRQPGDDALERAQAAQDYERAVEAAALDMVRECVVGWSGVEDAEGNPVEWSAAALDEADMYEVARLIELLVSPRGEPENPPGSPGENGAAG